MAVQPGDLEGGLIGLRAGVGEERPVHAGQRRQPLRQFGLQGNFVEVGGVQQGAGLVAQRLGDRRMGVAEAAYGEAAEPVQIAPPVIAYEVGAFSLDEGDRQAGVGVQQMAHGLSILGSAPNDQ